MVRFYNRKNLISVQNKALGFIRGGREGFIFSGEGHIVRGLQYYS